MDSGKGKAFRRGDDTQLSRHFRLSEFTHSDTAQAEGIDNTPSVEEVAHLRDLAFSVLEPIRDHAQEPVYISSGYRSKALNSRVGGVYNSQHTQGKAADIYFQSGKLKSVYDHIVRHLTFDQCILYPTFIHISYNRHNNRREAWINEED